MSEEKVVRETARLCTRESLAHDLRELGLRPGMRVLVHSSLSSLGWVCGGAVALVEALMDVVTDAGTLVMPTQTGNYSDPASWQKPPVPQPWWDIIYEAMPAFRPEVTPSYKMGVVVEAFRTYPGVLRSNHPQVSFAAWGHHADQILADHGLEYGLGERSPLARMYELNGWALLLGVGYDSNTTFHLAEYRVPGAQEVTLGAPIIENGQRVWKRFKDIELDADIFPAIGHEFEQTQQVLRGSVGQASCRLFQQRPAIDFAAAWLKRQRGS
ncbi:aminoglycoside N(3)-acetyltransferase [Dictyobacter aurantiacus]|uniref:Aminoglycoside N(3)-acetyltransferase n=1 Tax=Dictyobacter aurantiacus TaxID=1936993 RepID=A0A401ZP95_9CHLR|nr:AAC(3) family N-acetyltransferase [Dictyobacter aurantiacus]GCE08681.1 AAC(3) family N-acetyltransferase [Dictyobacter aurantiacus]